MTVQLPPDTISDRIALAMLFSTTCLPFPTGAGVAHTNVHTFATENKQMQLADHVQHTGGPGTWVVVVNLCYK